MKTRVALAALAAVAGMSLLGACGPDSELVASGRIHSCHMKALQTRIQANPQDTAATAELLDRAALLKAVVETAAPGKRAQLEVAIQKAVAKGCP